MDRLPNIHPGEVLREEFLVPLGITPYRLAKSIGVPQIRISQILNGQRDITPDTALRLARFFDISPEFWIGLQNLYDLEEIRLRKGNIYDQIRPYTDRELAAVT